MKFSIVIPVYKIPYDYLRTCIESCINQTYTGPYEIIIIDDESPDECGKIADEYANKYDNVRVIHQRNGGLSVVRNVGFEQSKGEWVTIIDGDDCFEPNALEIGDKYLSKAPDDTDVYIFDTYIEDGVNPSKPNYFLFKEVKGEKVFRGQDKEQLVECFFPSKKIKKEKEGVDIGSTWARFYRRSFIVNNNLKNIPGLRRMQDNIFNLYVIDKASTICYCCERIHHYRIWNGSAAMRFDPQITVVFRELYNEFWKFSLYKNTELYKQRCYNKFYALSVNVMMNNFVHPNKTDSLKKILVDMRSYFTDTLFSPVYSFYNTNEQKKSYIIMHYLLRHKLFLALYLLSKIQVMRK